MWEKDIDINEVREIRVKTTAFLGVGAISKIETILQDMQSRGFKSVIILTGKNSYKSSGAWEVIEPVLKDMEFDYRIYDRIKPNPEADSVDEAVKMASEIGADMVMGIGGGSPIDAAKAVAVLLKYPEFNARDLCDLKIDVKEAAPVIAVNLTHGTGTEVDRFSVITVPEKEYKPALAYESMYPMYAIDDPALMTSLGKDQSTYVSIDAVNHVTESATTNATNPLAILLAKETIRLVHRYLPEVRKNPDDLTARYWLTYAALIAGTSFDNGLLHLTHAMEHPLSAVKTDLTHGLGLSVLLPSVVKAVYSSRKEILDEIYAPIFGEKKDMTAEKAEEKIREWLSSVGVETRLSDIGFSEKDIEKLTELAFTTPGLEGLLGCAPIKADRETVAEIYRNSL